MMLGVLDEYGVLDPGQVYVQFSDDNSGSSVVTGTVLVTKFPCVYPGDVRKLVAVNHASLSHLKDCIVFPQKGHRPHCNEMAGSDLDGDEYAVIWYENLFFSRQHEPMVFPDSTEMLEDQVTDEKCVDFLCDIIVKNNIGFIANCHLAISDYEGIFTKKCKDICEKYSQGLDFAKTGIACRLEKDELPDRYPDFMGKQEHKSSYLSTRVVGQMYRRIKKTPIPTSTLKTKEDNDLIHPDWKDYQEVAEQEFEFYKKQVFYLMKQFGVCSELNFMSGILERDVRLAPIRDDVMELQDLVAKAISSLMTICRRRFKDSLKNLEEGIRKASAYYVVGRRQSDPFTAFPWIASEFLAILKTRTGTNSLGLMRCVSPSTCPSNPRQQLRHFCLELPHETALFVESNMTRVTDYLRQECPVSQMTMRLERNKKWFVSAVGTSDHLLSSNFVPVNLAILSLITAPNCK